jgi:spore maturation protein B
MNTIIIYILIILLIGSISKIDVFKSFKQGVEETIGNLTPLFVNIFVILFSINILISSGFIQKIFSLFKIEEENSLIFIQCFLKPISWSSSLIVMNDVINKFGVDSKLGILSALIQSSSDTAIYISVFYFAFVKNLKSNKLILKAILANILTFVFCVLITEIFVKL